MSHDPTPKQMTNEQLAELIRSHILAMRGEITSRLEGIDERLKRIEAKLDGGDGEGHE